jgi:tetratricopeptide (TPR) repeat protein
MAIIDLCRILSTVILLANSESAYELFSIGNNLELEGDIAGAVKYYERVLEITPQTPEIYTTLANALYKLRRFERGIEVATKGLTLFPDDINMYNAAAIGYIGKNDLAKAIAIYEQALILDPEKVDIYNSLSILYEGVEDLKKAGDILLEIPDSLKTTETYVRLGTISGKANDHHKAIDYYRKGYAMDTTDVIALIGIGTGYDLLNVKDSAIYYYEKTLDHDSLIPSVGKRLVDLYSDVDDFNNIIAMAKTVLEIDHFDGHVRRSLGYAYYKIGQFDPALDEFLLASRLDPGDTYSRFYAGKIYLEKGIYNTAKNEIEQALRINPDFIELWIYLGFICIDLKDFKTAEYAFTQAGYRGGDLTQVFYLLGVSAEMQGNNTRAYFHYHKALGMDKNNLSSLEALANLCERIGKTQETFRLFNRIIEIDTTNATALNYVGYTYAEKNERLDYALELVNRALILDPSNAYYIDSRGWVYYKMGEYEKALNDLERAVSLVEDAVILEHLGDVYIELKQPDKARAAFHKALEFDPANEQLKAKLNSF